MKLYRLTIDIPMNFAYIEYPGFDFDFSMKLIMGEKIERFNSSEIIIKNKTKFYPSIMGSSNSSLFLATELKEFLITESTNTGLNFISCLINRKEYHLLNIVGLKDYMDYEKSVFTTFKLNGKPDKISKLVVKEDKISENEIFRLLDKPTHVFVTEHLKEKIESQNFTGIEFIQAEDLTKDY